MIQVLLEHHSSCLAKTNYGIARVSSLSRRTRRRRRPSFECYSTNSSAQARGRCFRHAVDITEYGHRPSRVHDPSKHMDTNRPEYREWIWDMAAGGKAGTVAMMIGAGIDLEAPGFFPEGWSMLHVAVHNKLSQ